MEHPQADAPVSSETQAPNYKREMQCVATEFSRLEKLARLIIL
jgi:hypothetical protein